VGIETGFMGPNYSISTACATANYAFVAAANHIRQNEADVMIVGGSEAPIIPVGLGGFVACRCALSCAHQHRQYGSRGALKQGTHQPIRRTCTSHSACMNACAHRCNAHALRAKPLHGLPVRAATRR